MGLQISDLLSLGWVEYHPTLYKRGEYNFKFKESLPIDNDVVILKNNWIPYGENDCMFGYKEVYTGPCNSKEDLQNLMLLFKMPNDVKEDWVVEAIKEMPDPEPYSELRAKYEKDKVAMDLKKVEYFIDRELYDSYDVYANEVTTVTSTGESVVRHEIILVPKELPRKLRVVTE